LCSVTGNLNHLGNEYPTIKLNLSTRIKTEIGSFLETIYYALQKQLGQHAGLKRVKSKMFLLNGSIFSFVYYVLIGQNIKKVQ